MTESVLRVSAAALCALLFCLLLRRTNPELAALLSLAAVLAIVISALSFASGLAELRKLLREDFGLSESFLQPVLKCVAAAIVTRLTAELCREASQPAAAAAVELAGTLCALGIVLPLLITLLKTAGDWL